MGFVCCLYLSLSLSLALLTSCSEVESENWEDGFCFDLESFQKDTHYGHLHILLGRDDDRQVTVENEDGVHERDMVANNYGCLRAMRRSSLDRDVVVTHCEQDGSGSCSHSPQRRSSEPIEGFEERIRHTQQCQADEDVA